jgi:hypothetical protein
MFVQSIAKTKLNHDEKIAYFITYFNACYRVHQRKKQAGQMFHSETN